MIDQRASEIGLFDLAKSKNAGIIIRTPLVFGFLTGKLTDNEVFSENDHRKNWPQGQITKWGKATDLFSILYNKRTPVQAALRFCLDQPSISTVIPGMRQIGHVEKNMSVSDLPALTQSELALLRQHRWDREPTWWSQ